MTSTYMNATSPNLVAFELKSQQLLDLVAMIDQVNTNSASLVALTPAVVATSVVQVVVEKDYLLLQEWCNQFMTLTQQQNDVVIDSGNNIIVTITFNPANLSSTPLTYVITSGTTPVPTNLAPARVH